jgi:dihydrofolate reductase
MRKIVVLSFMTLDGVVQAPGALEEDPSGGFKYGGWQFSASDALIGEVIQEQTGHSFDLLLGRKTYDIFASYWPKQDEKKFSIAAAFNKAQKYVASSSPLTPEWSNSVLLKGDVVEEVRKLKTGDGPELQVHGSGNFVQTLLKNDLVDELWLKIYPITLGPGKHLFAEGAIPATWEMIESQISPKGVIVASYRRAGEVKTGSY